MRPTRMLMWNVTGWCDEEGLHRWWRRIVHFNAAVIYSIIKFGIYDERCARKLDCQKSLNIHSMAASGYFASSTSRAVFIVCGRMEMECSHKTNMLQFMTQFFTIRTCLISFLASRRRSVSPSIAKCFVSWMPSRHEVFVPSKTLLFYEKVLIFRSPFFPACVLAVAACGKCTRADSISMLDNLKLIHLNRLRVSRAVKNMPRLYGFDGEGYALGRTDVVA